MNILRSSLLAFAVLLLASSARAGSTKEEGYTDLTIDQVSDLIAKKEADIFDNNQKDVYAKSHLPTAKWVQFTPQGQVAQAGLLLREHALNGLPRGRPCGAQVRLQERVHHVGRHPGLGEGRQAGREGRPFGLTPGRFSSIVL